MNTLSRTLDEQINAERSAVLVIDAQQVFCSSDSPFVTRKGVDVSRIQAAIPRINNFVDEARERGLRVIWIRQELSPTQLKNNQKNILYDEKGIWYGAKGSEEVEFYSGIKGPLETELVITKPLYDAFSNTTLDLTLTSLGIEALILCGFVTNICVESTARHGFQLGYDIVTVSDCTDSNSKEEHDNSLNNLGNYFGIVASSPEILAVL